MKTTEKDEVALRIASKLSNEIQAVRDVVHGIEIVDPYRWLECPTSPKTRAWLDSQAAHTQSYFDGIPQADIRKRVCELTSPSPVSVPWCVVGNYFSLRRLEGMEQPAIIVRRTVLGEDAVVVSPGKRGIARSASLEIVTISADGRFLAYSFREKGTDCLCVDIFDLHQNRVLPDGLPSGLCGGFAFAEDGSGYYYSHQEADTAAFNRASVRKHEFGTPRSADQVLFCIEKQSVTYLKISAVDGNLAVYELVFSDKRRNTTIYLQQIQPATPPVAILEDLPGRFVPFLVAGRLFGYTDIEAPNFRIVEVDPQHPTRAYWRDIVGETDRCIRQFCVADHQLFITRVDKFTTTFHAFDLNGNEAGDIPVPPLGTVSLARRPPWARQVLFSYTSIGQATTIYCYETTSQQLSVWEQTKVPSIPSDIEVREVNYPSRDGTEIPLLVACRASLIGSRFLPVFLSGYGGFGLCATPRFTVFSTFLLECGFLLAVPALRGGSELGEQWHEAGKRHFRQNAFDDFISAAEWLVSTSRADPNRIAIGGGSNAGLLVAAALTQRPALFRAAICLGPLLDMLRYHLFDLAELWIDEYGSSENQDDFHCLRAYSPYHRVQEGTDYPAVLFVSGDADTRCNPLHTRKMVARMQKASVSTRPILLDYKNSWGHAPIQPFSVKVDALTKRLAFICHELGVSFSLGEKA